MDERVTFVCLFATLTLTGAAQFDLDVAYRRRGNHVKITPGSYLVVHGVESFNDVLWYVPTESAPPSSTSSPTTTSESSRRNNDDNNNLVQRDSWRSRHRARGTVEEPSSYEFGYGVRDAHTSSNFGHEERRRHGNAQGQYRVLLPDGRLQIVDYEADRRGFRPSVRYKDPRDGKGGNPLKTFRTY